MLNLLNLVTSSRGSETLSADELLCPRGNLALCACLFVSRSHAHHTNPSLFRLRGAVCRQGLGELGEERRRKIENRDVRSSQAQKKKKGGAVDLTQPR